MTQTCSICGKGYNVAWTLVKLRGKFNPTVKRKQKPNLQWVLLASGKRVKACTKCIKATAK
ncbi:MAG: 50S ribosomal protein L28 [Candidatus Wildermuthbacteria bacterium]|nr:50S ribosomal protein L28 [Candidatus Wildermuthbacteria bacterium]